MAETIVSPSNQNFIKTFLAVLIGVLVVVPLTTFLTFLVINSQMGAIADNVGQRLANIGPVQTINSGSDHVASLTCVDPDAKTDQGPSVHAHNAVKPGSHFGYLWGYNFTSNTNISNTSTTTNTKTVSIWDNGNTNTDNRNSGNSNTQSNTNTNTNTNTNVNTTVQDNGNTNNSGNSNEQNTTNVQDNDSTSTNAPVTTTVDDHSNSSTNISDDHSTDVL